MVTSRRQKVWKTGTAVSCVVCVVGRGAEESALGARRLVEAALSALFGSVGAAAVQVDVLRAAGGRALLRVQAGELRRLRAALALSSRTLRVKAQSPTLQAIL